MATAYIPYFTHHKLYVLVFAHFVWVECDQHCIVLSRETLGKSAAFKRLSLEDNLLLFTKKNINIQMSTKTTFPKLKRFKTEGIILL